jgi:hypothetical protein
MKALAFLMEAGDSEIGRGGGGDRERNTCIPEVESGGCGRVKAWGALGNVFLKWRCVQ